MGGEASVVIADVEVVDVEVVARMIGRQVAQHTCSDFIIYKIISELRTISVL